jgi:hypothetical protein
MSEETAVIDRKIKRAARLLFCRHHKQPGVKGWELRKALGKGYLRFIEILNQRLEPIGLQIRIAHEEDPSIKLEEENLDQARFYIGLREPPSPSDLVMNGWRIDDVAVLAVAVAYVLSKDGKAPRKDLESILREKFPKWKVEYNINRFIRMGYLKQDNDVLLLDWRSKAEIDSSIFVKLILGEPAGILSGAESKNNTHS